MDFLARCKLLIGIERIAFLPGKHFFEIGVENDGKNNFGPMDIEPDRAA
jgi:hypothetical protein